MLSTQPLRLRFASSKLNLASLEKMGETFGRMEEFLLPAYIPLNSEQ